MAGEPESVVGSPKTANSCTVEERRVDDVAVLAVAGTLDVLTAPELEVRIKAAAATSPTAIVVDLGRVDFLGSSGMGVLVAAHEDLAPAVRVVLVADGPATSRPLKLVGIADIIDIFPTLDEALTALNA
ncbi:STAS domain-containing protein [Mycobacterium adipatum]|jgi:anti-sigma B factor antagonist|uniref:STAS domain-containing protein n=1 Tax=Mycobacterium adipatum TaxID=1682113 RepID=UPI0034E09AC0